jgi:hypothetical protein
MTKKDFELIANVIANLIPDDEGDVVFVSGVVEDFVNALAAVNPRFDRERFINACQPKGGQPASKSHLASLGIQSTCTPALECANCHTTRLQYERMVEQAPPNIHVPYGCCNPWE